MRLAQRRQTTQQTSTGIQSKWPRGTAIREMERRKEVSHKLRPPPASLATLTLQTLENLARSSALRNSQMQMIQSRGRQSRVKS